MINSNAGVTALQVRQEVVDMRMIRINNLKDPFKYSSTTPSFAYLNKIQWRSTDLDGQLRQFLEGR